MQQPPLIEDQLFNNSQSLMITNALGTLSEGQLTQLMDKIQDQLKRKQTESTANEVKEKPESTLPH